MNDEKENLQMNKSAQKKQLERVPATYALLEVLKDVQNQENATSSMLLSSPENSVTENCYRTEVCSHMQNTTGLTAEDIPIIHQRSLFDELLENLSLICLPANWYIAICSTKKCIAVYELEWKNEEDAAFTITKRNFIICKDMKILYIAHGKRVNPVLFSLSDKVDSLENLNQTLERFGSLNICCGISIFDDVTLVAGRIGYTDNCNQLRHIRCPLITDRRQCEACKNVRKVISQKKLRMRKSEAINNRETRGDKREKKRKGRTLSDAVKKKLRSQQSALKRAKRRIIGLKSVIQARQSEVRNLKEENVLQKCKESGISAEQQMCVKEIMAAAQRKNSKGRRYTEDWVLLCILLHIRSPSAYDFLRQNGVMPLPAVRTLRRYLSLIDMNCGFDKQFFQVFEKHIRAKPPLQRHGLLLLDEISLRKSISVKSSDLTYTGLVDFGEDGKSAENIGETAKYALVLMFQPLADKYNQPIAVFASRGPVKGVELAKLVAKALVLLENTGALVHGIVSDGAETNRKMWTEFGVCGSINNCKNWFSHPANDERKVYAFSDTPHLMKCIRNRLYSNEKQLRVYVITLKNPENC